MLPRSRACSATEEAGPAVRKPRPYRRAGFFFSCSAWFILHSLPPLVSARTISNPARSTDDIPPAPPSHIQARDWPDDSGAHIVVTWVLSEEDQAVFVALGASTVAAARGPVSVYRRAGILGYRIYRTGEDGVPVLAGEVGARVARFDDSGVENNMLFIYEVRSFDQGHEVGPRLEPGSTEDMARRARAIDNLAQPVDAAGEPIRGWFNRTDSKVGLDDFFIFADHFGVVDGELNFADEFDLNGDFRIDFDDFFIFTDNFGKTIANFDQISGDDG